MPKQLTPAVRPRHYKLQYSIDFSSCTFTGSVETELIINGSQQIIRQHCKNLTISTCEVTGPAGTLLPVSFSLTDDELLISGTSSFTEGTYLVRTGFSGMLSEGLSGLYRSSYSDDSGNTAYLVTTQFEAPYARQAFPCFDEPQFKATFALSMNIPAAMTGISNMPAISEQTENGRKKLVFDTTPPMSTYLLYFGAGMFDCIEEKRGERTIRVYGVNGKSRQGAYALSFAADTLEFYERYTGIPYPLPKLDLIAIPDFAAGAMENWGAVTFREVLLYVDERETSLAARKRVAEVVAHELWHQWSGNLVTMQWWNDLWLNEAFATYNAFRAVAHFHPDWHIWDDFLESETGRAFDMDMLNSTHPIAVTVETPNEIEESFDAISYGKGGSVLCMIEQYIGEEAFRKGVSAYLSEFAYKNAVAKDLWNTLEVHSGKPVKEMLISWITTPGFPLLFVRRENDRVAVQQKRFSGKTSSDESRWPIPLTWLEGTSTSSTLFDSRERLISTTSPIVKFNAAQTGFYRTLYQAELYPEFYQSILEKHFSAHDRYGILDDLWAGVLAGYAGLSELQELMNAYRNEDRLFVLENIAAICGRIALYLMLPENGKNLFSKFKVPFAVQLNRLGWSSTPTDTPEKKQLRALAISFMISAGDEEVIKEARMLIDAYLQGGSLDPDLRNACLCTTSLEPENDTFEKIKAAYEARDGVEEKIALLSAMAHLNDTRQLEAFLQYTLSDRVRRQDLRTVFSRISSNPLSSQLFFSWVRSHWAQLDPLRESYFVFMNLLQAVILTAVDMRMLSEIRTFLERHTEGYINTRANTFEKAELHLRFREREEGSSAKQINSVP